MMKPKKSTTLHIKVIPKSRKSEIVGWEGTLLKVRLAAVPEKGAANKELIRLLSDVFKIPKSHIRIIRGETSRNKTVLFTNEIDIPLSN